MVKKWGKLYKYNALDTAENWSLSNGKMTITSNTGYREPDVVTGTAGSTTGTSYDGGSDSNGKTYVSYINDRLGTSYTSASDWLTNELEEEFNNMIESVEKYRGFYVGRYETSLRYSTDTANGSGSTESDSNVVQSKPNKLSATAANTKTKMWYGLYASQRMYAAETNSEAVESSMIWGSQYDAMMKWMDSNHITVTSSTPMSNTARNESRITGNASYNDQLNKVYDLYGSSFEWILEAYGTIVRANRGGRYGRSGDSPSSRYHSFSPTYANADRSSRLALYVK